MSFLHKKKAAADRLHEQTMKMIEDAPALPKGKHPPPTVDPKKLAEACDRLQKIIEKENAEQEKRLEQLNETAQKLRKATDLLQQEIDRPLHEAADWRRQGCPVTADIKVGKPLVLKPKKGNAP